STKEMWNVLSFERACSKVAPILNPRISPEDAIVTAAGALRLALSDRSRKHRAPTNINAPMKISGSVTSVNLRMCLLMLDEVLVFGRLKPNALDPAIH